MMVWAADRYREIVLAFLLLTRLPMPAIARVPDEAIGGRVWAFPLVGSIVGAIGAAAYAALHVAGVPVTLGALAAVLATVIATGAFHEDGFADFFDGVGGGQSVERKLEIMRDSRIGTYGAVALLASLAARTTALGALADPLTTALALITTHAASRGLIGLIFLTLSPARKEGLAASGDRPKPVFAITALGLGLASVCVWPIPVAISAALAGASAVALIGLIGWRYLRGYTGDMLGASEQAAEIAMLTALSAWLA